MIAVTEKVRFEKIIADQDMQIRASLSEDRIKEFYDIFEKLPPMKLVETKDGKYHLADGFHRHETARRKGIFECNCEVVKGDLKKVLEIAIESNCRGPLTLSLSEKRNLVDKTLRFFPERANSWIADMVGVSMQTVELRRTSLESGGTIEKHEQLETRDGRMYPRKVVSTIVKKDAVNDDIGDIIAATAKKVSAKSQIAKISDIDDAILQNRPIDNTPKKSGTVGKMFESPKSENNINMFVDNIGLVSYAISDDGKSAVGIKKLNEGISDYSVYLYEFANGKFFPNVSVVLSNASMHDLIQNMIDSGVVSV
jgi:hypothetical protein